MTTTKTGAASVAPDWPSFEGMVGVAVDWVWEQDTGFCFTRLSGDSLEGDPGAAADTLCGHTRWELGLYPADNGGAGWASHHELLQARRPFRGQILRRELADGSVRFISISGAPCYDQQGRWSGYRGVGQDVTDIQASHYLANRFQVTMEASPDCILVSDTDSLGFVYVNDTVCQLTGFSRQELLAMSGPDLTGRTREQTRQDYARAIAAGISGVTDEPHVAMSKNGDRRGWWQPHHRAVQLDGRWIVITVSREVTRQVLAERAALRAKRMYAALSATNEAFMRASNADELFQQVCEAAVNAGGLTNATLLLPHPDTGDLCVAGAAGAGTEQMRKALISVDPDRPEGHGLSGIAFRSGEPCVANDFLKDPRTSHWHEGGRSVGLRSAASVPILRDGRPVGVLYLCAAERRTFDEEIVALLQRMTENLAFALQALEHEADRERAEARVRYLATHDSLTDLPNRALFGELLDQALATAHRYNHKPAVMFIDLDRFKLINDSLGHAAGDLLLQEMAKRLRSALRESDVLARIGGDEFVILLQDVEEADGASVVGRKLLAAALASLSVMGQECRVSASIGIGLFPQHGEDAETLMKNADTAMYLAKENGKNTFEFYVPGMQSHSNERLVLEAALRNALTNHEFRLHYQAKLDLKSNRITGVEALLRWPHPTMGDITPQQFIPLCEESGAIIPIGRWVLNTACEQNMAWQREGLPSVKISVNLSARQFSDPDLLADIRSALESSGMDPSLLELELTESMVMINPAHTIKVLEQLRALGVRTALDDFGVGYSSLAQIKGFPIDTLKVDRSFIRNLPESNHDRAITEAIINMARTLSLTVIAEGVETQAQENFLRDAACDQTQGFYFSKPVAPEAFSDLLRAQGVEPLATLSVDTHG